MDAVIELQALAAGYDKKAVFSNLDLKIFSGECLGLFGPNGSGKTTFLKALMGLYPPLRGTRSIQQSVRFGYCMQRQAIDMLFPFTVFEVAMMARTKQIGPLRRPSHGDRQIVMGALETAGIRHLSERPFNRLSGGEQQRVIIARALSIEPTCLILDEPTTYLDVKVKKELISLIRNIKAAKQLTVIFVSHELNEVLNIADRFLFMNGTGDVTVCDKESLTETLLSDIFQIKISLTNENGKIAIY
ncbi:ATP-binding cassette domain-containing protein [bacterium]|nr:ATP-binding cassette domain-containing protein [bacterium]MCP5461666.1 ATP-binding cassette domain-containing protein [bacterium]